MCSSDLMSVRVEEHDIQVKAKNAEKFLMQGHRVKLTIRFRGREMAYTNQGKQVLLDFAKRLEEVGTVEKNPKLEGRNMSIYLTPMGNKDKSKKKQGKEE